MSLLLVSCFFVVCYRYIAAYFIVLIKYARPLVILSQSLICYIMSIAFIFFLRKKKNTLEVECCILMQFYKNQVHIVVMNKNLMGYPRLFLP